MSENPYWGKWYPEDEPDDIDDVGYNPDGSPYVRDTHRPTYY